MPKHSNLSNEKQRLKYFLWEMIKTYQPNCYFCNKPFKLNEILPPRGTDNLTEHHKNGIHNTDLKNKVLAHRACHKAYHTKDNINKKED